MRIVHTSKLFLRFLSTAILIGLVSIFLVAPAFSQKLPDLVVTALSVNNDCFLMVTLKNQGPGPLPVTAYQSGSSPTLQLYKNNQPFGAWGLPAIDPGQALLQPGGTVTWTRPSEKIAGNVTVRAEIDSSNVVAEADETNNKKTLSLSCNPPLPDPAVTQITFTQDCLSQVHLKNVGDAALPDQLFSSGGAYLMRTVDGVYKGWVRLGNIDPGKALKNPGGTLIWTDLPEFKGASSVRFKINQAGQEKSTANNEKEASVPCGCGQPDSGQEQPDLTVTGLSVDQQCLLKVTLKNNGSGQLPDSSYQSGSSPTLQLYKNNQPFGAWGLPAIDPGRALLQPGGTVTWTRPSEKIAGNITVRAEIDSSNVVAEADETNNKKTSSLSCNPPLPDLAVTQITFTRDCLSQVQLKNVGDADLPDNVFSSGGAYLMRTVDGAYKGWIRLQDIDPGKALKNPGGTKVWTDYPQFKAASKVKFTINQAGQEKSTTNNSMEVSLPSSCSQSSSPVTQEKVGSQEMEQPATKSPTILFPQRQPKRKTQK